MGLAHSPRIVTDGLVLCLDAGNTKSYLGSGTTWSDLSGNGNNGTLENDVGYDSGNGGALSFDGVDDYVRIPHSSDFNLSSNNFTIEGWIESFVESQTAIILVKRPSINFVRWVAIAIQTNQIRFWLTSNDGSWNIFEAVPFGNISTNTPCHFAVVRNGSNFTGYLNTVPTIIGTSTATVADNTSDLIVGADIDDTRLNGRISKFSIYNRALTEAEVQQNYNALRGRFGI